MSDINICNCQISGPKNCPTHSAAQEVEPSASPSEPDEDYRAGKPHPPVSYVLERAASGQAAGASELEQHFDNVISFLDRNLQHSSRCPWPSVEALKVAKRQFFPVSAPASQPSAWYMKPCPPEFAALITPRPDWIIAGPDSMSLMFSSEELEKLSKGHLQIIPLERLKDLKAPIERCQSRQPHGEKVQCELPAGHKTVDGLHLSGQYCWRESARPASEEKPSGD